MSRKKWVAVFLVAALALLVASVSFAADQTDRAKDFGALHQQMMEIRKEMIKKHVEYGDITPEQATAMENRMTEHYERMKADDFKPRGGMGMGMGPGPGPGPGHGPMGGKCFNNQKTQTPAAQ